MKTREEVIENLTKALFHVAAFGYSEDKIVLETMEEVGMSIKDAIELLRRIDDDQKDLYAELLETIGKLL